MPDACSKGFASGPQFQQILAVEGFRVVTTWDVEGQCEELEALTMGFCESCFRAETILH